LDGIPDYVVAILPSALGFGPATSIGAGKLQTAVTAAFLTVMFVCSVIGSIAAFRRRSRVSDGAAIAITWLAVAAGILLFGIVVDPVWFYSAHLAIVLWMSVALIPRLVASKPIGVAVTLLIVIAIAYCTLLQNLDWYRDTPSRVSSKIDYLAAKEEIARLAAASGAEYVYGSYYDVLPVAYASAGEMHPVTNTYNRFPIPEIIPGTFPPKSVTVVINSRPTDDWGIQAWESVQTACESDATSKLMLGVWKIFKCPTSALVDFQ
jgi:hypothetical protein